ncbi:MAG: histidine kinase dimerization/phosphoacceptor domain -containing protein [Acidobacteriota bacterium]|nr:histidine kinase dimerization/phosphoacceptor domain -containing protein [Acidobacteriota bacterium]
MPAQRPPRPGDVRDYEYIINHSPVVIFLWRRVAGWPVDFVSENVRLFGYTPEDFTSGAVNYSQIIHPADMDRLLGEIREFMAAGRMEWIQEYRILTKTGQVRWVEDRTFAPPNPEGIVTHLQGLIMDVTEPRAVREALRVSESKLRGIVEQSGDGIVVTDEKGMITEWNTAQEKIGGRRRAEVLGRPIWDVQTESALHQDPGGTAAAALEKAYRSALEGGDETWLNKPVEVQLRRPDGTAITIESVVAAIPAELGFFLAGISRDVTEKRRAEETLARSLREKEVLLKEVNHRVKNNMQVLSSLLNFQSSFIKDPEALRMLQESRDRIRTMALIHEKLYRSPDLSRIDFAEYLEHLSAILVDSYAMVRDRVKLELDVRDAFLSLNAGIPCGLIVNELVSNALKHAFPDGRSGRIRVELKPAEEGMLRLVVADDGIGLPAGAHFGADSSVGLQIVGMLVDQLDGTIETVRTSGTEIRIVFRDGVRS